MDIASGVNAAKKAADVAVDVITVIESALKKLKAHIDEVNVEIPFTFAECVKYFVSHTKGRQDIARGAILRRPVHFDETNRECWEISLVFLDENDEPICDNDGIPLGFKTVRAKLDRELENSFKNNDLIFME